MERVLTLIRFQLDSFTGLTDIQGLALLHTAFGYMQGFPGLVHHPAEEILLARLPGHRTDSAAACEKLAQQHAWFGRHESAMLLRMQQARSGDELACRRLQPMGISYCLEHAAHFAMEESEVFPQALEHLPDEDWTEIRARLHSVPDPIFEGQALLHYGNVYDALMALRKRFDLH